jgi:flagellar biogenesis protein FliO
MKDGMTEKILNTDEHNTGDFRRSGFAGWLLQAWSARRGLRDRASRRLQLVETLPVGSKRQLMLVRCGDEYFLAGGGVESISTIVKVGGTFLSEAERCV